MVYAHVQRSVSDGSMWKWFVIQTDRMVYNKSFSAANGCYSEGSGALDRCAHCLVYCGLIERSLNCKIFSSIFDGDAF